MMAIRTYLQFEKGKILEIGKYDPVVSTDAATIESLKFLLRYLIAADKLSGKIHIESRESKLYIRCDVKPKKYGKLLMAELRGRFDIMESV
jgi:hypothetical protein